MNILSEVVVRIGKKRIQDLTGVANFFIKKFLY
jgi:hypothetical protein